MLIGEYILSQKSANGTLPENPAFVESIVSTDMGKAIAAAYGVKAYRGFNRFQVYRRADAQI